MVLNKAAKNILIWAGLTGLYLAFIWFFTYIYPISEDEMLCPAHNFYCYYWAFTTVCARIGGLIGIILIQGYKWLFLLLNPLAQLALVYSIFYLLNLRNPDFRTLKDLPQVIIIALMSVFMVAQPDQTIFWFAGSVNYLFLGVLFIAFCAVLRKTWHEPDFIPSNPYTNAAALFAGIILGMNNENSAPMIFCLCGLYTTAAIYFKRKMPPWFIRLFIGVAIGLTAMFSSPAYHKRAYSGFITKALAERPLLEKLYSHTANMDLFMSGALYALPLLCLSWALCLLDKFKTAIKSEDFFFFSLSCFISLVLAIVLFPLPIRPARAFYSASLFTIIALLFFIKYIRTAYKFNLTPYLTAFMLIYAAYIFLPFAKPYTALYRQSVKREAVLSEALKADPKEPIALTLYEIPDGPTRNLTIEFFDPMKGKHIPMNNYYGREFFSGQEPKDNEASF